MVRDRLERAIPNQEKGVGLAKNGIYAAMRPFLNGDIMSPMSSGIMLTSNVSVKIAPNTTAAVITWIILLWRKTLQAPDSRTYSGHQGLNEKLIYGRGLGFFPSQN